MTEIQKEKIYNVYKLTGIGIVRPTPENPDEWEFGSQSMSIFTEFLDDHIKRMNKLCKFKINKEELIEMWKEDILENDTFAIPPVECQ